MEQKPQMTSLDWRSVWSIEMTCPCCCSLQRARPRRLLSDDFVCANCGTVVRAEKWPLWTTVHAIIAAILSYGAVLVVADLRLLPPLTAIATVVVPIAAIALIASRRYLARLYRWHIRPGS